MGKSGNKRKTWWKSLLHRIPKVSWLQLPGVARDSIQAYNEYQYGKQIRRQLPVVMTLLESLVEKFGEHNYATGFNQFLSLLGVVAQFVQVLQGDSALRNVLQDIGVKIAGNIEAQTGLQSPRFAKKVHQYISQRAQEEHGDCTDHFFFVYHPDTDWHPAFFHRVKESPLPTNFLGMSSNLDTLCIWMLFIRRLLAGTKGKFKNRFHILIPAYRPLVIRDPIIFPPELYPLTIEGHIHNSIFQVWFNIPDLPEDDCELLDVGNLAAPPSFWQRWAAPLEGITFFGVSAAGGSATMGLAAVAATAVGPPLAIPVFLASGLGTMFGTGVAMNAVNERLRIPEPRLLGGNLNQDELEAQLKTRRVRRRRRRRREGEAR